MVRLSSSFALSFMVSRAVGDTIITVSPTFFNDGGGPSASAPTAKIEESITQSIPIPTSLAYETGTASETATSSAVNNVVKIKNPNVLAQGALKVMNLTEKASIVTGSGLFTQNGCSGEVAALANHPEIFNGLCIRDGTSGVRDLANVTGFCSESTLGATWDKDLVGRVYEAMADEFKGKGSHVMNGPVAGGPLGRSPYSGRSFENFGSDPVLAGDLTYAAVQAIQSRGVQAVVKHFIGNEQETFRNPFAFGPLGLAYPPAFSAWAPLALQQEPYNSVISDRALHEVYAWGFAEAVRAGTSGVMCSYNQVNGTQSCQNDATLNKVLKDELGFQGYVVSDWGALYSTAPSINAGLDLDMPGGEYSFRNGNLFGNTLVEMVQNGQVSESRLDDAVLRILTPYFNLNQKSISQSGQDVRSNHYEIVREAAEGAITLLKNNRGDITERNSSSQRGGLPLNGRKIGVFGSDAGISQYGPNCPGSYAICPDSATNNGTVWIGGGSGTVQAESIVTPLDAIRSRIHSPDALAYNNTDYSYRDDPSYFYELLSDLDTAIVFVSIRAAEGSDRTTLHLDNGGDELIKHVASGCRNTIVVMHVTNPPIVSDWIDHPNVTAVLNAYAPGEETGSALASILFGDVSPSGKLPWTIAKSEDDYIKPMSTVTKTPTVEFSDDLFVDYRRFDRDNIQPQFPFGFGLSYTNFSYDAMSLEGNGWNLWFSQTDDKPITVKVSVSNTGSVIGSEVVQLYLQYPDELGEPPKVLRGFEKVKDIHPGQQKTVEIPLSKKSFMTWDVTSQDWELAKGTYTIHAAANSRDMKLNQTINIGL